MAYTDPLDSLVLESACMKDLKELVFAERTETLALPRRINFPHPVGK